MVTKLSILLLFGVNLLIWSPAIALSSSLDQTVILNEQGKPEQGKEAEKNPEDDCE